MKELFNACPTRVLQTLGAAGFLEKLESGCEFLKGIPVDQWKAVAAAMSEPGTCVGLAQAF